MKKYLKKIENYLKINFNNKDLLRKKSYTHKSFDEINNNEKLEFLGDRVIGLSYFKKITYPLS